MSNLSIRHLRSFTGFIAALVFSLSVMAQSWQVPKPTPGLMPSVPHGKKLFDKNCASCHGLDLKGSKLGPPFLHAYYVSSHHGDAAFQLAAKNGVQAHHWKFGDMKPVPTVNPDDVAHITAYVRYKQRLAGIQ